VTTTQLRNLHRAAGNGAVTDLLARPVVQRISVPVTMSETLQQKGTTTSYQPKSYGQTSQYELDRDGDRRATATVRILFHDPTGAAIPESDPRRGFGSSMCSQLTGQWNGKFRLVGKRAPGLLDEAAGLISGVTPTPVPLSLPVVFSAVAVFDPDADHDAVVALHADSDVAKGGTSPIDSGNWYTKKDAAVYPSSDDVIYAHEYGHLLGIPDEYSLSNPDMHARLHGLQNPAGRPATHDLDKATIRQLVMAALQPALMSTVASAGDDVSSAMAPERADLVNQLRDGLRETWRDPGLQATLTTILEVGLAAQPKARKAAEEVVRFEATDNMSYADLARGAVDGALDPATLQKLITNTYRAAVKAAVEGGSTVTLDFAEGSKAESTTVDIETVGVPGANATLDTAAATAAAQGVGTAFPPPVPGLAEPPPALPSGALLDRLDALPSRWRGVANLLAPEIGAFPATILALGTPALALVDPHDSPAALYRAVLTIFTNIATAAANQAVTAFLADAMRSVMDSQMGELRAAIEAEAERQLTTPLVAGVAPVAGSLTAAVATMVTQAKTMEAATPTATSSNVRMTTESLMGDNNAGTDLRVNQLDAMVGQFNGKLKKSGEDDFTAAPA